MQLEEDVETLREKLRGAEKELGEAKRGARNTGQAALPEPGEAGE